MNKDTILFDINETVLDLSSLNAPFKQVFGHEAALSLWFTKLLHSSTVCITTNVKSDFASLAGVMLDNVASLYSIELTQTTKQQLLANFASLQPHADIKPALTMLREKGYRTVAFSNSSSTLIHTQLSNAGLMDYFDDIISVEETQSFKPDPQVYQFVANKLGMATNKLRLVATHDWDCHGALSVGLKAAYIARTPAIYHPLYIKPEIQAATMMEIARLIIESKP